MPPKLLLTIRTANRAPQRNYLEQTVSHLIAHGVEPAQIQLFATEPDGLAWARLPAGIAVHIPRRKLTPNENGIAQTMALARVEADWIVMTEDDLEWCADPLGSMASWLDDHARPDVSVYRFFAFDAMTPIGPHAATAPLREQKGSQAVALRANDARRFAAWALAHPLDWRPTSAPFQHQPHTGFDKLVGYWALQHDPSQAFGMVATPFFCRHVGVQSSLHAYGKRMDHLFAGADWSYGRAACLA